MIEAKIIKDSIGPNGARITTFILQYPRFIHSEMMTHRMFSRNASSSRAIPVKKQIQMVIDNPAVPIAFARNQKGMQPGTVLDPEDHEKALQAWLDGRDYAVATANRLANLEVHKQYANRVLEPWAHITVVVTATDWTNFFALRCHEAAQAEIHQLADQMYTEYHTVSSPTRLRAGQWHLPFVTDEEKVTSLTKVTGEQDLLARSVARAARVSYLNHDGTKTTLEQDLQLYDRLVGSAPIHASPAEHQAMAVTDPNIRSGNFRGWIQYRQGLKGQNVTDK